MGCPAKYARSSEALAQFKAALEQGLGRVCPNPLCGRRGSKDDACTHMTCDLCRTKWCYVCGLVRQASDEGRGPLLDAEEKIVKCLGCDYLETTSAASEQQQHFMFCKKTGMPHDDNSQPGPVP